MVKIFTEGKKKEDRLTTEQKFLKAYLFYLFPSKWTKLNDIKKDITFIGTDGWTNLFSDEAILFQLQKSIIEGDKNIVIFDADYPKNEGGFAKRQAELLAKKQELNLDFDLFLFPNNKDDGDFEYLLENIIKPEHSIVLRCFERFETCISKPKDNRNNNKYHSPDRKSKIYTYVESMQLSKAERKEFKNGDFFFSNTEYWDLNHSYLNPLKDFLSKYNST